MKKSCSHSDELTKCFIRFLSILPLSHSKPRHWCNIFLFNLSMVYVYTHAIHYVKFCLLVFFLIVITDQGAFDQGYKGYYHKQNDHLVSETCCNTGYIGAILKKLGILVGVDKPLSALKIGNSDWLMKKITQLKNDGVSLKPE